MNDEVGIRRKGRKAVNPREDRFIIRIYDSHPDGQVKACAIMQYLQEAAASHAEELGMGIDALSRQDCFWVLVNLRMEVVALPRWNEQLMVTTWPSGCRRLIASREFIGRLPDGRELFRA